MRGRRFLAVLPAVATVAVPLAVTILDAESGPPPPSLAFTVNGGSVHVPVEPIVIRRRTITPEFDPPLAVRAGRVVYARGFLACDPGEVFRVDVTVRQGETEGEGRTAGRCNGEVQAWTAVVTARDGTFESGPSSACAVATSRRTGVTDRFEWCGTPVLAAV